MKNVGFADMMKHIVSRQNGLVVHVVDKDSAVAAIPNSMKIQAKIIRTEYAGIIKMDTDFDVSQISLAV